MSGAWSEMAHGEAPRRAAAAMLRALGGSEVVLRIAVPMGTQNPRGLGLQHYEIGEVRLSPAIVRRTNGAPDRRWEVLLPASEVEAKLGLDPAAIANALRPGVSMVWKDVTLRVTEVNTDLFAGCEYLYRISAGG